MNPSDNFNLYIREVTPLPIVWQTPHDSLAVCEKDENGDYVFAVAPDSKRRLKLIHRAPNLMKDKAASFCNKFIPSSSQKVPLVIYTSLTPHFTGHPGLVSAESSFGEPTARAPTLISSPDRLLGALTPVIKTLDAILGSVWPRKMQYHHWKPVAYAGPDDMPDRLLGNMWTIMDMDLDDYKFIIFNLGGWTFSAKDVEPFLNIGANFPKVIDPEQPEPAFNRVDRIWAMIWDMCAAKRCPWFALTNSEVWIFGVFMTGWTQARVTDAIHRDSTTPSVLQCLLYWIASAMELEKTDIFKPARDTLWYNPDIRKPTAVTEISSDLEKISDSEWLQKYSHFDPEGLKTVPIPGSTTVFLSAPEAHLARMGWV